MSCRHHYRTMRGGHQWSVERVCIRCGRLAFVFRKAVAIDKYNAHRRANRTGRVHR